MKVCVHLEFETKFKNTGIGNAVSNICNALRTAGVEITKDVNDDYDLLVIHTFGLGSWRVAIDAKKRKKKVVMHCHTTPENAKNSFWFTNLMAPFVKKWLVYFYNLADLIICPSNHAKSDLRAAGVNSKIFVVGNTIDVEKCTRVDSYDEKRNLYRKKYGLARTVPFCVGFVIPRKGVDTFVEVAKHLPHLRFVWFGRIFRGILASWRADKIIKSSPSNVTFTGYVDDITAAYAAGDIFLLPTLNEVHSVACLEAMAFKKPIIVRDLPSFDWVEDNIHCLKAVDEKDFVKKLELLVEDEHLQKKLAANAYAHVQNYGYENIGNMLKNAYEYAIGL